MGIRISEEKMLKELIRLLERRENITSLTEYYHSTEDIYVIASMYQDLTGEDLGIRPKTNKKLSNYMRKYPTLFDINLYYYFSKQDEHTKLPENINKIVNESGFIFYDRRDVNKLTEKEFFEIERDFLATHDERILKLFDSYLNKGLIDMRNKTGPGVYSSLCSNNHYVVLPDEYNIANLVSISHELGHLYGYTVLDLRSKKQLIASRKTYYESISHYMELCLLEYLKKNHIYLGDTAINENDYYGRIQGYFIDLENYKQLERDVPDCYTLVDASQTYLYSYGILIGTYLHERYLNNPVETKKDIYNYIFNQGLFDRNDELEYLGLSKEELNKSKVLAKRLQKHNEFYKKTIN